MTMMKKTTNDWNLKDNLKSIHKDYYIQGKDIEILRQKIIDDCKALNTNEGKYKLLSYLV